MKRTSKHSMWSLMLTMVCGLMLLASCSKSPDYSGLIPSDAVAVVNFDLGTIVKKGDLKNANDLSFVKMLREELSNENSKESDIIEGIFDNPATTGIDMRKDLSLFVDSKLSTGVIASLKSKKKFEKFLKSLSDDMEIVSENGISCLKFSSGSPSVNLAWDSHKALFLFIQEDVAKQMNLSKDESLAVNKDFNSFWKNRGDISIWYSMDAMITALKQIARNEAFAEIADYSEMFHGVSVGVDILFEKGAIRNVCKSYGIDENSDMMKLMDQKFNDKLLAFMPENTLATVALAYNMKYLSPYLSKLESTKEIMEEELAEGVTISDILATIDGSMLASLYGFDQGNDNFPLFAVAVDLKDASKFTEMIDKLEIQQENGIWSIPGIPLYFGLKDNTLFATDDAKTVATVQQNGFNNGLKDVASKIKKSNRYFYANLNLAEYPVDGLMDKHIVDLLQNYLDYTEMTYTSKTECEVVIYLKNKKKNSLANTLHLVDDIIMAEVNFADVIDDSYVDSDFEVDDEEYYIDEEYD